MGRDEDARLVPLIFGIRLAGDSSISSLCPEASDTAVTTRFCSVATEVNRQFLGQDSHLLDDDAFHGARKRIR